MSASSSPSGEAGSWMGARGWGEVEGVMLVDWVFHRSQLAKQTGPNWLTPPLGFIKARLDVETCLIHSRSHADHGRAVRSVSIFSSHCPARNFSISAPLLKQLRQIAPALKAPTHPTQSLLNSTSKSLKWQVFFRIFYFEGSCSAAMTKGVLSFSRSGFMWCNLSVCRSSATPSPPPCRFACWYFCIFVSGASWRSVPHPIVNHIIHFLQQQDIFLFCFFKKNNTSNEKWKISLLLCCCCCRHCRIVVTISHVCSFSHPAGADLHTWAKF